MIADKISNLHMYKEILGYENLIREFIEKTEKENLEEGKYELDGEKLFALVQNYTTTPKEGRYMEAHELYADMQYIVEGEEIIYWDFSDELTIREDRRPEGDIMFFENRPDKGGVHLTKGMFGVFYPGDAHMPCIAVNSPLKGKKIVFKIRCK